MATVKPAVRVVNMRQGAGFALAFFTLIHGFEDEQGVFYGTHKTNDMQLKRSKEGELYAAFPEKKRERGGVAVIDETTKRPIYDPIVGLYVEKVNEEWKPTKVASAYKGFINEAAIKVFTDLGLAGAANASTPSASRSAAPRAATRGAPPRRAAAAPSGATTAVAAAPPALAGGDDDLPF